MNTIRQGAIVITAMVMVLCWVVAGAAGPTKAQKCEAAKNQAAGAKAECLAKEYANEVLGKIPNFAKCDTAFMKAFAKAEQSAGVGVCPTEGDTAAIEAQVDICMADIANVLAGHPPTPPCEPSKFPATGQTTCWNSTGTVIPCAGTGQDGDVLAGAVLSYTDNGDGTITDHNTGLMWEKKSADGTIHDRGTHYTWDDALAVHVAGLNAEPGFRRIH